MARRLVGEVRQAGQAGAGPVRLPPTLPTLLALGLLLSPLPCGPARAGATAWAVGSGDCSTDGAVVYSPKFPENYEHKGLCEFTAHLSGPSLIATSFEVYDPAAVPKYALLPVEGQPFRSIECVCINDAWEAEFNVTLDANLSLGYVGGDRTDKQPPWKMELDFVCRAPCVDINRFGDACSGECENPWQDRDGLTCATYESRGFCEGGTHLRYDPDYFALFIGERSANRSALGACCACGGGTGTPLAIAPFCEKDGVRYGCDLPGDTQCSRIELVAREPLVVYPAPAPAVYVFDINNLPEYGWGVVGALVAVAVATFVATGCCVEQAKRRRAYLASLVPES